MIEADFRAPKYVIFGNTRDIISVEANAGPDYKEYQNIIRSSLDSESFVIESSHTQNCKETNLRPSSIGWCYGYLKARKTTARDLLLEDRPQEDGSEDYYRGFTDRPDDFYRHPYEGPHDHYRYPTERPEDYYRSQTDRPEEYYPYTDRPKEDQFHDGRPLRNQTPGERHQGRKLQLGFGFGFGSGSLFKRLLDNINYINY